MNPKVETPDVFLTGTGLEVAPIVAAEKLVPEKGIKVRLAPMPCWELFQEPSGEYREQVLPSSIQKRLEVETGVSLGWREWVGEKGGF